MLPDEDMAAVPLPGGWQRIWSEERRSFYFWNKHTKESTWNDPYGAGSSTEGAEQDFELPEGCEKHFDAESQRWYSAVARGGFNRGRVWIWLKIGSFRGLGGTGAPGTPLDRPGPHRTSICTKNQPRRPIIMPFRGGLPEGGLVI